MDNQIKKEVISILVDNQANVLTRVISLFGRRGFNIDSLTVSTTNDPKLSRITVVFTGTEQALHFSDSQAGSSPQDLHAGFRTQHLQRAAAAESPR